LQECLEAAQKLNSLWRGKHYAPLLQQPFSADAISALPKGIKLLQRSADFMQKLAAVVDPCQPYSDSSSASEVAAQQTFLQELQQHNPAQLAAELLGWLQAWPDLPDALLYAGKPIASSNVQVAAELLWHEATPMLTFFLAVVQEQAAANVMPNASLELLEQLVGPCCTTGEPCLPREQCTTGFMNDTYRPLKACGLRMPIVHALVVGHLMVLALKSCICVVLKSVACMRCVPCRLFAHINSAAQEHAG
jgi:hypothetical protein